MAATYYSYESIQCAPGHVVSGGQWGTIEYAPRVTTLVRVDE